MSTAVSASLQDSICNAIGPSCFVRGKFLNHVLDLVSGRCFVKFWVRDTRVRGMGGIEGLRDAICFQFIPRGKRVSSKLVS